MMGFKHSHYKLLHTLFPFVLEQAADTHMDRSNGRARACSPVIGDAVVSQPARVCAERGACGQVIDVLDFDSVCIRVTSCFARQSNIGNTKGPANSWSRSANQGVVCVHPCGDYTSRRNILIPCPGCKKLCETKVMFVDNQASSATHASSSVIVSSSRNATLG